MTSLIPFHGTQIVADLIDGTQHIAIKPLCESLGIDSDSQIKRLKRQPWASTVVMTVQLPGDNQARGVTMIDRRTFTMWLATIQTSRIKDDAAREPANTRPTHCYSKPVRRWSCAKRPRASFTLTTSKPEHWRSSTGPPGSTPNRPTRSSTPRTSSSRRTYPNAAASPSRESSASASSAPTSNATDASRAASGHEDDEHSRER